MKRSWISPLLPALLALPLTLIAALMAFASDISEGQKLYQKGRFVEASAYFNRAVETNNYDATAHYYLANCFMGEKAYAKAALEYQRAMEFTDDTKMEDYCRNALSKLSAFTDPKPAAHTDGKSSGSGSGSGSGSHSSTTGAAAKEAKVQEILAKSKSDAKTILDRAEERCRPIMEEQKQTMATMNIAYRGRVPTTTSEEKEDAKKEFEQRLGYIRSQAKRQADVVLEQGRHDAASVGQGLPNLDDLLAK